MKIKYVALALLLMPLCILVVNAGKPQWNLGSGYDITTNYQGVDVILGTAVTATAGTTNTNVKNVTFVWKYPNVTEAYIDLEVPVTFKGNYWTNASGTFQIFEANSSYVPLVVGDWGVQALFMGPGGHLQGQDSDIVAIRATSFNVIPEITIVGTAGAVIAMLLGLGLFRNRKRVN